MTSLARTIAWSLAVLIAAFLVALIIDPLRVFYGILWLMAGVGL